MDCDFTEEVSPLVDGELAPREAARLGAHLEGCAACRQARESFLLLRRGLRSYDRAPDPHVQRAALASILDAPAPRGRRGSALWGSLAEAFGVRSLRPAHAATLALLLTATALGLLWLRGTHTSRPEAPAAANANGLPAPTAAKGEEKRSENSGDVDRQSVNRPKEATPQLAEIGPAPQRIRKNAQVGRDADRRTKPRRREGPGREPPLEVARVTEPALPLPQASVVAAYAAVSLRAAAADDDASLRIGRHAERLERLLRSFRNARLTKGDPTLDVTEARRLSRRLLYSNIALRREAAGAGDLPAEGLLDSVEPILIDISNLPDDPSAEAVGSIKERIGRRRLVGALQAQGMLVSR
jgi:hypothetical protein